MHWFRDSIGPYPKKRAALGAVEPPADVLVRTTLTTVAMKARPSDAVSPVPMTGELVT